MASLLGPDMTLIAKRISEWAAAQPEIRLILVVGSRARQSPPPDQWSDLDLSLFCTDFNRLVSDAGWLENIGEVWVWLPDAIAEEIPQLLVLFEGGVKVDFGFFPLRLVEGFAASQRLDVLHDRGFYPLVDKDGWASRLPAPTRRPLQAESPADDGMARPRPARPRIRHPSRRARLVSVDGRADLVRSALRLRRLRRGRKLACLV
jgi:hypothetical protein